MKRREFIALIGAVATTWPVVMRAEVQSKHYHIAVLLSGTGDSNVRSIDAFRQGLRELGLDEGQNVDVQYRYAEGDLTQVSSLVAELVGLKPDVIVTNFTAGALAAKQATSAIPIVSWTLTDPVALGLVASEARPGGNVTGLLLTLDTLAGKILQLLVEMIPGITKIGVLSKR
jgi:putative tryptophan/tyrosine transport system substrate-binding protein